MSEKTGIAWTDHTFNPWWGCVRVSPGCEQCYAERDSKRYGFKLWGPTSDRRFFGDKHWNEPRKWDAHAERSGRPARVFCASMADVFEDRRDLDEPRARLFALVEETRNLRWQLLTKRPENARRLVPASWREAWPDNAWALVTAEDQQRADERIPLLFQIPARVRGVSYEPALGRVDFFPWVTGHYGFSVDWVIVGGESGHAARPFRAAWARSAIRQCKSAGVPVFVKQMGANVEDRNDSLATDRPPAYPDMWPEPEEGWSGGERGNIVELDSGYQGAPVRIRLKHRAGADPNEWPRDLRVRAFPAVLP